MNRMTITPLTRVEGHGDVTLKFDGEHLEEVTLRLQEPPRLFESLLLGKSLEEVPLLASRICAICSYPHALAAILALEDALNVTPPPAATRVRELGLLGNLVQSHALHLIALVLPDLRGRGSLVELLQDNDPVARRGVELKQLGNRVQELVGGRLIHPVTLQVGGVLKRPGKAALADIVATCSDWSGEIAEWQPLFSQRPYGIPAAGVQGVPLAADGAAALNLWGGTLQGGTQKFAAADYREQLIEQVQTESNAMRVTAADGFWRTGALARRELSVGETPPTESGIFGNNLAQLAELELALQGIIETIIALNDQPDGALLHVTPQLESGIGTIALEAPRGTLIHQYGVDDGGRIASADIITPTTINQVAIEEQLFADLARSGPPEQLKHRAEQIVRAFDPCISCAVHLIRT